MARAQVSWGSWTLAEAAGLGDRLLLPQDFQDYQHLAPTAQARSLAGRAALRALLRASGADAWRQGIHRQASGALLAACDPGLAVSVSHSHQRVAAALARGGGVGIDIEWIDPGFDPQPVVRRHLHPREAHWLASLAASQRQAGFYALWTAKEAVVKCLQQGLGQRLDAFFIEAPFGCGRAVGLNRQVRVRALPASPGYRAALAWCGVCDQPRRVATDSRPTNLPR